MFVDIDFSPRFVVVVKDADHVFNQLFIPHVFCMKYVPVMPCTVKLSLVNGYEIWLDFDKNKEVLSGVKVFLEDFGVVEGQTLVFLYVGGFDFHVRILGLDGSEIEYPFIRHPSQTSELKPVDVEVSGLSFATYVNCGRQVIDEVVIPETFIDRVGMALHESLIFVLRGGDHFVGCYNRERNTLSGIASFCKMLGKNHLDCYNILFFTYDGSRNFNVNAFDAAMVETSVYPIQSLRYQVVPYITAFHIMVGHYDMLPYTSTVEIMIKYRNVALTWDKADWITVCKDDQRWILAVYKHKHRLTTSIINGWIKLRDDCNLAVGDICVFEWKDETLRNFNIRILKNDGNRVSF